MFFYSDKRTKLYEAVGSHAFIMKYVFVNNLQMQEGNKATLVFFYWLSLKDLLEKRWVDFKILGIASVDGDLIKKTTALVSFIIVFIGI